MTNLITYVAVSFVVSEGSLGPPRAKESNQSSTYAAPLPRSAAIPISTVLDSATPSNLSPAASDSSSIPVAVSSGSIPVDESDRMKSPRDEDTYDLTKLRAIQEQLEREKSHPSWDPTDIEFIGDPSASPTLPESSDHLLLLRKGPSNSFIRGHLEWLKQSSDFVATLSKTNPTYQSYTFQNVRKVVQRELDRQTVLAWNKVEEEWNRQRRISLCKQRRVKAHNPSKQSYLIIWILAAVMHFICNIAVERMAFLLGGLRIVAGLQGGTPDEIISFIPKEMDTIAARLDLEPHYTTFACCPRCFQLYDKDDFPTDVPTRPLQTASPVVVD
ncbi:hypothetical protein C8J55DRAFT_562731 [Lentinula edodes]|uniref:Uncharacterized protein n=1 Tax=Lentinula lateritia TaxID=40482 RepID=A0A9W9DKL9_9AGAR|nr:hypothetical protein C8J55DRAFT_562731 [Lentinula edodes]